MNTPYEKAEKTEVFLRMHSPDNPRSSEGDFLRLPDGRIIFAFSMFSGGYLDDSPSDIAAVFSSDNGESFPGAPEIIAAASDHGVSNVMSVSLLPMANGDAGLFYIVKLQNGADEYVLRRSRDGAKSFGEPVRCLPCGLPGYYVINNNRVIRTSSGSIVIPAAFHRSGPLSGQRRTDFDGRATAYFFRSDDDGESWYEERGIITPPACANTDTGLQEPGIVELSPGVFYAYMRTDQFCQYQSFSTDDLKSWTPAEPSGFSAPPSPLKIAQNPFTGEFFAVWNPIPLYFGRQIHPETDGRTPLVLARSGDGRRFHTPLAVEDDPKMGFCYPALFFADANTLLLSYCFGGPEQGCFLNCLKIVRIRI